MGKFEWNGVTKDRELEYDQYLDDRGDFYEVQQKRVKGGNENESDETQ